MESYIESFNLSLMCWLMGLIFEYVYPFLVEWGSGYSLVVRWVAKLKSSGANTDARGTLLFNASFT